MSKWKKTLATVLGLVIGITFCGGGVTLVKAAQTYYVSEKSGNDSNAGTSKSTAFKTLKKAVNAAGAGDAIRILDTLHQTGTLNISKEVTIGRAANMTDYMIVLESGAELTLRGDVVINGRKAAVKADKAMIHVKAGATLNIKGRAVLKNNYAALLPGGAVVNQGTMSLSGNCVLGNNETVIYGGGAICNKGELTMSGGTIRNNTAGEETSDTYNRSGGGVLNENYFQMTGGTITGNTAIGNGGGIHNAKGSHCEFAGGTISENKADEKGGGICCSSATLNMTGGTIQNNTATGGGGILFGQEDSTGGDLYSTISGGTISGNKSVSVDNGDSMGHGGGVLVRDNNILTIAGGSITENVCDNSGGGIRIGNAGTVIICGNDVSVSNNVAAKGGGIYVRQNSSLQMSGGTLTGNQATKGKGIFHSGFFALAGNVCFDEQSDIYLYEEKYVILSGNLKNSQGAIVLTPSVYTLGRVCARTTKSDTMASAYDGKFALTEKSPYLLRPGDALAKEAGVLDTDVIISRGYSIFYDANIDREVDCLPESGTMYWKEPYHISEQVPTWSDLSLFEEWNTKGDGSGTSHVPGETIEMPVGNWQLYAQWSNLPPEISASDSYAVEDEIEERVTKEFLIAQGKATDPEEGNISQQIEIANWDEIISRLQEPYTQEETSALKRIVKVRYKVQDSCKATAETEAQLVIFLLGNYDELSCEGYVRFIEEEYVEYIENDTFWGTEEKKAYLRELFEKDTSQIEWEN